MSIESQLDDLADQLAALAKDITRISTPVTAASYDLKDTATVLGVSTPIVTRLIREGHLIAACYPGMTARRVPRASIDALLAKSLITQEIAS